MRSSGARLVTALATLALAWVEPAPVRAQPSTHLTAATPGEAPPPRGAPLSLPTGYRPFETAHFVLTSVSIAAIVGKFAIGPLPDRRRGGWLVDDQARRNLMLDSETARRGVRDASDVLLTTLVSYPFFEAVVLAGWYRRSPDVASQMSLINAEAMAVTGALQAIANVVASRERPYGRVCGSIKPEQGRDCDSRDRYYSFFSGHTSQAFVSAALVCTHNDYLPLYGRGPGGGVACASALTLAGATGVMRMAGDQHYLTDVVTGAIVGTTVGLLLPRLLHYGWGDGGQQDDQHGGLSLRITPTPTGLWAIGWF